MPRPTGEASTAMGGLILAYSVFISLVPKLCFAASS